MEYFQDATNVCLSGGADGADLEWGACASLIGHKVIHWSFPEHQTQAPEGRLVRLNDDQLAQADDALSNAASALGKRPPSRPKVLRLLQRNYFQVAWSTTCYAVTVIGGPGPPGGTAWATTMFAQLHPENRNLFVFDQQQDAWFQVDGGGWDRIDAPPRPTGVWAGVGSRDLKPNGVQAIRLLMGCEGRTA